MSKEQGHNVYEKSVCGTRVTSHLAHDSQAHQPNARKSRSLSHSVIVMSQCHRSHHENGRKRQRGEATEGEGTQQLSSSEVTVSCFDLPLHAASAQGGEGAQQLSGNEATVRWFDLRL